jgi:hypothetical protein
MKRLILVLVALTLAALTVAPLASAHTGTATITCNSVTFSFTLFKDATTVIHETVAIDGEIVATNDFTLVGSEGSNTIAITVPAGTHTVVASASWTDSEGGGSFEVTQVLSGCEPGACTFTKGFYRNHPDVTADVIASAGGTLRVGNRLLSAPKVQAILNATPGRPGKVSFSSNLLLNLAQQLITAELNVVRGASAPTKVLQAINAANAGITTTLGSGGRIGLTTSLSRPAMSRLVDKLSKFNEGRFEGAASCG